MKTEIIFQFRCDFCADLAHYKFTSKDRYGDLHFFYSCNDHRQEVSNKALTYDYTPMKSQFHIACGFFRGRGEHKCHIKSTHKTKLYHGEERGWEEKYYCLEHAWYEAKNAKGGIIKKND